MKILFVCLGNICRSPTAEAVLRSKIRALGLEDEVKIDSAGTGAWHIGSPPDERAVAVAAERGYDVSGVARQADAADFVGFDVLIGMDRWNYEDLQEIAFDQDAAERIQLLREYDPATIASSKAADLDVPDPYEDDADGFERVLEIIERSCEGLLEAILNALGGGKRAWGLDSAELRKRAVSGFATNLELIGAASTAGGCLQFNGAWALITPTMRDQPIFNAAFAASGGALAEWLGEVSEAFSDAGVRRWRIEADVEDTAGAEMLESRGLAPLGIRRAMAMALSDLRRPRIEIPADLQIVAGRISEIARVADCEDGLKGGWAEVLATLPELPIRIMVARRDGYPVAGALSVDVADDLVVCLRVSNPEVADQDLVASCLIHLIDDAEGRGRTSVSIAAHEDEVEGFRKQGFQDLGGFRCWEFSA